MNYDGLFLPLSSGEGKFRGQGEKNYQKVP
jgi:hypothetical protein